MRVIFITGRLDFFKRRIKITFHLVKESGAEGITEESIIEMLDITPKTVIAVPAFRNKTVDVRIPF